MMPQEEIPPVSSKSGIKLPSGRRGENFKNYLQTTRVNINFAFIRPG
jgi:hypothetical protein